MSRRSLLAGCAIHAAVAVAVVSAGCATAVDDGLPGSLPPDIGGDGKGTPKTTDGGHGPIDSGSPLGDDAGNPADKDSGSVDNDSGGNGSDTGGGNGGDTGTGDDAGNPADTGPVNPTCNPGSLGGFTTKYHAPGPGLPGDCSTIDIDDFYTACLGPSANNTDCQTFQTGFLTSYCYSCLVTQSTSSQWGPLIAYPTKLVELNVGGCYALVGGSAASTCARSAEYQGECDHAACDATCGTNTTDFDSCATAADQGGCSQYATAVKSQCAAYATGACALSTSFEASFKSIAAVFCGP